MCMFGAKSACEMVSRHITKALSQLSNEIYELFPIFPVFGCIFREMLSPHICHCVLHAFTSIHVPCQWSILVR